MRVGDASAGVGGSTPAPPQEEPVAVPVVAKAKVLLMGLATWAA